MMTPSKELLIGYDYDAWYGYSEKVPVCVDASTKNNSQTLICGMSGSGKSYLTNQYFARICLHGGDEFATRLCESGMNIKMIQDILGHTDISTTMDLYTHVTQEMRQEAKGCMEVLDKVLVPHYDS